MPHGVNLNVDEDEDEDDGFNSRTAQLVMKHTAVLYDCITNGSI
jgi:hypothetical protein